jgi:hypothetical protein
MRLLVQLHLLTNHENEIVHRLHEKWHTIENTSEKDVMKRSRIAGKSCCYLAKLERVRGGRSRELGASSFSAFGD